MIYIIIPTYNRPEQLKRTIEQLSVQTFQRFKVLIVNSGETDYSFIHNGKIGTIHTKGYFTSQVNTGIDFVKQFISPHDIICVMNDDNTFDKNFLLRSVCKLTNGSLVCSTDENEGIIKIDWKRFKFTKDKSGKTCSTRAIFLFKRDLTQKLCKWLPMYLSDYDWVMRLNLNLIEGEPISTLKQDRKFPTFSVKNPSNPIFFTIFILRNCPKLWIIPNIIRVWVYSLIRLFYS